jgi:hypothetical protein
MSETIKDADKVLALIEAARGRMWDARAEPYRVAWTFEGIQYHQGWTARVATFTTYEAAIDAIGLKFPAGVTQADISVIETSGDTIDGWKRLGTRLRKGRYMGRPSDPAWDLRIHDDSCGSTRVYFIDADTGEEVWTVATLGNGAMGEHAGRAYGDTLLWLDGVDLNTRILGRITAEYFSGRRILVKFWYPYAPNRPEIKALVDARRGWTEYDGRPLTKAMLGAETMLRKVASKS